MASPVVIKIPRTPAELVAAHAFHSDIVGEFLLPRTLAQFDELAEEGQLWLAQDDQGVVAVCYVACEDDLQPAEFGGIVIHPDQAGRTGIATAMGIVAISAYFLQGATPGGLLAHVHVDNASPLPLLTTRLGFKRRDGAPVELVKAELEAALGRSITMRADANGVIRGYTYDFGLEHLKTFADRLESAQMAKVPVVIENRYFAGTALPETVRLLRSLVPVH